MLKVFLSYAVEDRAAVDPYFSRLEHAGFDPWIDHRKILPGQNWSLEIDRAFKAANVILIFLSTRSVGKRGFVQKEANDAFERLRQKLPDDIYIIPLLLETCQIPPHISERIQYIDLRSEVAWNLVLKSLRLAAEQQQIELVEGVKAGLFQMYTDKLVEKRAEQPKYELSVQKVRFESTSHVVQARELSNLFAGYSQDQLIEFRSQAWENSKGREGWEEIGSDLDSQISIAFANSKMLSLWTIRHTYFAGTAHGNYHYETHNFLTQPELLKLNLFSFFENMSDGLKRFSEICVAEVAKEYAAKGMEVTEDVMRDIELGAGPDERNFRAFTFDDTKFNVLFAPYQVGPYVVGSFEAKVKYEDLLDYLVVDGPHAQAMGDG